MNEAKNTGSLAVIGECMLELREDNGSYLLGYGGDVFNTAVYAVRLGLNASFITATGDDHYSKYLLEAWKNEGVATDSVRIIPDATPGLYMIQTDDEGERTFQYWRDSSPFKQLLGRGEYTQSLPGRLEAYDCIYFSGITLAVLPDEDKLQLLQLLTAYQRSGGQVAFDPNYRPKLWPSRKNALSWIDQAYAISNIAFPSFDDEAALVTNDSPEYLIQRIRTLGCHEVIMKDAARGAIINHTDKTETICAELVTNIVDTTAAGDSFNGGYLASRLKGGNPSASAARGNKIAATVIQHAGAIIPKSINLS